MRLEFHERRSGKVDDITALAVGDGLDLEFFPEEDAGTEFGGGRDGSATASGNADDDVECVAVYGGGTWTLHAVEAAVSLRVKRGEEVTTARPPALPPRENADDNDATTSDDELGAELEAALEEEEEGRRQPPQQPAPARGTLPSAELNDVEREFLGRG